MSTQPPSPSEWQKVINLAERVLGLPLGYEESDIELRYRTFVTNVHPDVVDDELSEEANRLFRTVDFSKDVLEDNISRSDITNVSSRIDLLEDVFDEPGMSSLREEAMDDSEDLGEEITEEVQEQRERRGGVDYTSREKRKSPGDFDSSKFGAVTGEKREDLIEEVSLGMRVMLRFNAVDPLLKQGVTQEDFYNEVNDFIDETGKGSLSNGDYYASVKNLVRKQVTKDIFTGAIDRVESNLGQEYVPGAGIDEIADVIAMLVVDGQIKLGFEEFRAGRSNFRRPGSGKFRRENSRGTYRKSGDTFRKGR